MTSLQQAILDELSKGPAHGWALVKSLGRKRTRVYDSLIKLHKLGLVTVHIEDHPGRGPHRKVYALVNPESTADSTPEGASYALPTE